VYLLSISFLIQIVPFFSTKLTWKTLFTLAQANRAPKTNEHVTKVNREGKFCGTRFFIQSFIYTVMQNEQQVT